MFLDKRHYYTVFFVGCIVCKPGDIHMYIDLKKSSWLIVFYHIYGSYIQRFFSSLWQVLFYLSKYLSSHILQVFCIIESMKFSSRKWACIFSSLHVLDTKITIRNNPASSVANKEQSFLRN